MSTIYKTSNDYGDSVYIADGDIDQFISDLWETFEQSREDETFESFAKSVRANLGDAYDIEEISADADNEDWAHLLKDHQNRGIQFYPGAADIMKDAIEAQRELNAVMTAAEAMSEYGLGESTVRQAINRGQIRARKSGETWLLRRVDVENRWAWDDVSVYLDYDHFGKWCVSTPAHLLGNLERELALKIRNLYHRDTTAYYAAVAEAEPFQK